MGGRQAKNMTHKTKQICSNEGQIWSSDGILHAQSFGMSLVPKQIAAATICPMKYETLKSEVITGRSLGYASSPINEEPETMQVGIPKPRIMRATMYMPTVITKVSFEQTTLGRAAETYHAERNPG